MAYEMREGQGSLFKNDKREKETHPNLKGKILINGQMYFLSGWTKEGERGKWISLSAQIAKDEAKPAKRQDDDEPLPF